MTASKTEKKQPGETGLSEIPRPFDVESPEPSVDKAGVLVFPDHPEFRPNLSPQQVLEMGSFGGTYFRPIYSSVTKQKYGKEVWQVSNTRMSESLSLSIISCKLLPANQPTML